MGTAKQWAILFLLCILQLALGPAQAEELLDLPSAQRLALQGNPGISAAQARIAQAQARVKQAAAAWRPSLDAIGMAALSYQADSGPFSDATGKNSQFGLEATWLLFDGHARAFRQEQAEQGQDASAEGKLNSQRLLVSAVADAFFQAQLAKTSIDIAVADQEFYEQQLADAKHRFDAGAGAWGDVLNIKVQLNAAKNSVIAARRDYKVARSGLAALLGIEDDALSELSELDRRCGAAVKALPDNAETLIKKALRNRPDMKRLTWQVRAAEAGAKLAEAQDAPKVQIRGQAGANSQDELYPEEGDLGATLTLSMSWNLYSGGATEAAAAEARHAKQEAVYSRADLRNRIAAEVQQDMTKLAAARQQVRLQEDSVQLVQENRKLAKSEYEAGAASLTRLNEAQRDLTATHGRLIQAVVACHQAEHQLLAAVGTNLDPFAELLEAQIERPHSELAQ